MYNIYYIDEKNSIIYLSIYIYCYFVSIIFYRYVEHVDEHRWEHVYAKILLTLLAPPHTRWICGRRRRRHRTDSAALGGNSSASL